MQMDDSFDYVVVGGGSAGCVLASRLSEDANRSVLLLEAGGHDNHLLIRMPLGFLQALRQPRFTWGYESEPEPNLMGRRLPLPRGRLLGGCSSINGMIHIRGHRLDFDDWHKLGCEGWSFEEVLPYFRRSETHWKGDSDYHGGEGPVHVRAIDTTRLLFEPLKAAAHAAGHPWNDDYDGAINEGFARATMAVDGRGRRHSTSRAYLQPVLKRPNLEVRTLSQVQRVLIEGGRAVGVEYLRKGRRQTVRARAEVVLCGGTYNSPQLLMLSGIGDAAALRELGIGVHKHLPGVGRNLTEHPRMGLHFRAREPVTFTNQLRFDRAAVSVLRWAFQGKGPFANQICSGVVLLKTRPELDRPDFELLCSPVQVDAHMWFPGIRAPKPHGFYVTASQLYPKSRGRVTLRSAHPQDKPRVELNLLSREEDLANMIDGVRATRRLFATEPQSKLVAEETLPGEDCQSDEALAEAVRRNLGLTHHPVGTCAMGVGADAVVDAQLRVHGIQGLRVADASIMPTIVGANTNAATIMIGEKAADLIRGRRLPAARL
jgi:choline dehydrogenase